MDEGALHWLLTVGHGLHVVVAPCRRRKTVITLPKRVVVSTLHGLLFKILVARKIWLLGLRYLVRSQAHVADLLVELVDIPVSHLDLVLLALLLHVDVLVFGGAGEAAEPSAFLFWSFLLLLVLQVLTLFLGLLLVVFL